MLSISCTIIKGDFPVNFTWTLDDKPLDLERQSDVNIVVNKRVSFLSIDSVAARHAGKYSCIASNAAGADSHTAHLAVNGTHQIIYICILIIRSSLHLLLIYIYTYYVYSIYSAFSIYKNLSFISISIYSTIHIYSYISFGSPLIISAK